ncbi:MAG TPA: trehalose-phosphatase [Terriglobia bacterium]|nr:trehalose-phosphatase [Terriglobia bacterium]
MTGGPGRKVKVRNFGLQSAGNPKSRHLFDHWAQVQRRLSKANYLALFLDFDGTITPLRPKPSAVKLAASYREVLRRLARHPMITLCFISGRRRAKLQKLVKVRGAIYVGLHGWERETGTRSAMGARGLLAPARAALVERLAGLPHVWVGDKGPCFDVHYHGASEATVRKVRAIVLSVFRALKRKARLLKGRDVWEFLPREFKGKGVAVRAVIAGFPYPVLPIYIGDDITDEAAFRALPNGITVRVGKPRRTRARFEVRNPDEVFSFLEKVEAEIA